ncbi:uncharacterized protein J7T54_006779 [Emericellopsis cladophorae]|uniref:Zn(2)-C6 fungal-type domain-containing protein n=1 Tax=Emericellopsis cladophorae TaxID=2686198 RepID=A0A9Q0BH40_9HYPO|nr:uncharacterized protein J7T54_006779 [Emericellopsis cladophorae]KAI6785137.1 hypothetical protein J7T54_006779 [Emericellopsis cladophorae]
MDDPYRRYLSSMSGAGMHLVDIAQPPHPVPTALPSALFHDFTLQQAPDHHSAQQQVLVQKRSKSKSRTSALSADGSEAVKHKRTRSGCLTCRSRRVKCDEKRPVCCQKGGRECVYPEPKGSAKEATRSAETSPQTTEQSDAGEGAAHSDRGRPRDPTQSLSSPISSAGAQSNSPADQRGQTPSPRTISATSSWSHLPADIQRHLEWIADNVTNLHYGIAHEADHFFESLLPQAALQDEALLNALVAFASYLTTVQNPDGDLAEFLRYHHRSITLLLEHFRKGEKHEISTLLTILQLAQIEEYLGDWVNVMGHQRAAFQVLDALFEPATAPHTPMGRMCFTWYARFDAYIAAVANCSSTLDRSWFEHMEKFCLNQSLLCPHDPDRILAHEYIRIRRMRWQQNMLFTKPRQRQNHPDSSFGREHEDLLQELVRFRQGWPPSIPRPENIESRFGGREPTVDELFQTLEGRVMPELPSAEITELYASWHLTMILHLVASPAMPSEELMSNVRRHAYSIIYYDEALRRRSSQGVLIGLQSMVQVACSVLRKDDHRIGMWVRRNLAEAEQMGSIQPARHREQMARDLNDPSIMRWWLPHDEGFTPLLRKVREFADERNDVARTAQQQDVREAKFLYELFAQMEIAGG